LGPFPNEFLPVGLIIEERKNYHSDSCIVKEFSPFFLNQLALSGTAETQSTARPDGRKSKPQGHIGLKEKAIPGTRPLKRKARMQFQTWYLEDATRGSNKK
jgi:hypothetical protein